jgi:hypothetical protein
MLPLKDQLPQTRRKQLKKDHGEYLCRCSNDGRGDTGVKACINSKYGDCSK